MSSIPRFKRIPPATLTVSTGTPTGDVSDIQNWQDGNQLTVQEAAGTPAMVLVLTFEKVTSILKTFLHGDYRGTQTHNLDIELYNYTTSSYDKITGMPYTISTQCHVGEVFDDTNYINGSKQAQMRINHPQSGNSSHYAYFDYIALLY